MPWRSAPGTFGEFSSSLRGGVFGRDRPDLKIAANQGRILVSHDFKTIPQHFGDFVRLQASPGVFLVSQRLALSVAIEELLMVWLASEAEEWVNRLCYLPL